MQVYTAMDGTIGPLVLAPCASVFTVFYGILAEIIAVPPLNVLIAVSSGCNYVSLPV